MKVRIAVAIWFGLANGVLAGALEIATFDVDATPKVGGPVAYAKARSIVEPLSARGVVLLSEEEPVVLCAVDWIGIGNGGYQAWRRSLAEAAGTTPERVTVHSLHQHDAPRCDFTAEAILEDFGLGGRFMDREFETGVIESVSQAIRASLEEPRTVTRLGIGRAEVRKVASNRRILGPDGKVERMRWSRSLDPVAVAAPVGVIDPTLYLLSFENESGPIAVLTVYATHPQSYYGKGDVNPEFPGMARGAFEEEIGALVVHFTGAGGNVAAGKFNDGSPENRPVLAQRLADGMRQAWEKLERQPVDAGDLEWRVESVALPLAPHLIEADLERLIGNEKVAAAARLNAASHLAWARRTNAGSTTDLTCLRIDGAYLLGMPGELFVEYQIAASKMRPNDFVATAAYADYGPGYIGTRVAYEEGGYETSQRASRVAPDVEPLMLDALERLLK